MGVAAHALDELHDRPLRHEAWATARCWARRVVRLGGRVAIGVAGVLTVSAWLAPLVLAGALFLPAYNLELAGGRFHSDLWFARRLGRVPGVHRLLRERREGGAAGTADRRRLHAR